MKAAVWEGIRQILLRDVPDPTPTDDDIVLAVRACGICGSDLHSYTTGSWVTPGQVMGHEFAGNVVFAGRKVDEISVGDRVTAMPGTACLRCPACVRGDAHLCYHAGGHSIAYGRPGAFAEYVCVPNAVLGRNVFRLPPQVNDVSAATVEPLSVAVHAVALAGPGIGAKVVVLGAGLIGQCVVQVLKASGAETIVVSEPSPARADMARLSGADAVIDPAAPDFVKDVAAHVGTGPAGRGAAADVVIDCAGVPAAFAQALKLVRPGGTLAITALYEAPVELDPNRLVWREMRVVGTYGYVNEFPTAIELLRSGKVRTDRLVTDRLPLAATDEGFRRQLARETAMKVVILPPVERDDHATRERRAR
jgi:(R,R)-butanediol dehydrogenase / meso-butanediol dehydrogenase / diacetyl reductase